MAKKAAAKKVAPSKKAPAKASRKAAPAKARAKKAAARKVAPAKKAAPAKASRKAAPAKASKKGPAKRETAKKAAPAKPARKAVRRQSDAFLEAQRKALLDERETYTNQATSLRAEAEQLAADREPGDVQFDEESGQGDTLNVERERDLALSNQALAAVEDIDRALTKIDAGTYGICERCGEPIPRERLRALPHAALCVRCKSGGLSRR